MRWLCGKNSLNRLLRAKRVSLLCTVLKPIVIPKIDLLPVNRLIGQWKKSKLSDIRFQSDVVKKFTVFEGGVVVL